MFFIFDISLIKDYVKKKINNESDFIAENVVNAFFTSNIT
jgi:hypothetical protein